MFLAQILFKTNLPWIIFLSRGQDSEDYAPLGCCLYINTEYFFKVSVYDLKLFCTHWAFSLLLAASCFLFLLIINNSYFINYLFLCILIKLVSAIFWKPKIIKFKNLDEIAIITNVYLHKHYQRTKTLCRHVSRFPKFTAWG